jgi:hypothetical protein
MLDAFNQRLAAPHDGRSADYHFAAEAGIMSMPLMHASVHNKWGRNERPNHV